MQDASAVVRIGLCRRHFRGKRFVPFVRWLAVLPGRVAVTIALTITVFATRFQNIDAVLYWFFGPLIVWFVAYAYVDSANSIPLKPAAIDRRFVWIDGVSPAYLAEVPDIPQSEPSKAEDERVA